MPACAPGYLLFLFVMGGVFGNKADRQYYRGAGLLRAGQRECTGKIGVVDRGTDVVLVARRLLQAAASVTDELALRTGQVSCDWRVQRLALR